MKIFSNSQQQNFLFSAFQSQKRLYFKAFIIAPSVALISAASIIIIYLPRDMEAWEMELSPIENIVIKAHPPSKDFIKGSAFYRTSWFSSLGNWIKSITFNKNNSSIVLDIPLKSYDILLNTKTKALEHGLLTDKGDFLKSSLRTSYSSSSTPIKLRLKGDWTDHLENGKWSFRIKTRKNTYYQGMKVFSVQPPATRSYIYESYFHKFLQFEKLPYLRYKFVDLIINGKNKGIYAVEEGFSKELIENSRYRESVILRFSELNLWNRMLLKKKQAKNQLDPLYHQNFAIGDASDFETASLKSFDHGNILEDTNLSRLYSKASTIFEQYASNKRDAIDTFEYKSWAKFFAITDILQTWHARRWHNMRFYFNPITGKFIPVGFDASFEERKEFIPSFLNTGDRLFLFKDYKFAEEYVRQMSYLASKQNLDNFFSQNNSYFNEQISNLNSSFPFVSSLENRIRSSAQILLEAIQPPPDPFKVINYSQARASTSNNLELGFISNHHLPLEVISVEKDSTIWLPSKKNYLSAPQTNPDEAGQYKKIVFTNENLTHNNENPVVNKDFQKLKINYKTLGSEKVVSQEFSVPTLYENTVSDTVQYAYRQELKNPYPEIFKFNRAKGELSFYKKDVVIDSTVYVPRGFSIYIEPGTSITFRPGASFISYSPIDVRGEVSKRVIFKGTKNTSILILNANNQSTIKHADFYGFGTIDNSDEQVTSAVTFYDSPVNIYDSLFSDNSSEDALNLFRSDFVLDKVSFVNTESDALDVDFSKGKIHNSYFRNIGNDALDFSGSNIIVDGATIVNASDKVLSAGEESTVHAKNIFSSDSSVGITSKDSSRIFAKNITFDGVDVCLAVFNKKEFFKGGSIVIDEKPSNCNVPYLVENSSSLSIEDQSIKSNSDDVESLMYGRKFGRATQR